MGAILDIRTILTIPNLYVAPMPPTNVGFNPHYGLGDVVWRISRWPPWISEWNELGSSESPQCLPPSFSLIWLTVRKQMTFLDFQDSHHGRYWNGTNLAILNFHVTPIPPTKFWLSLTYHSVADVAWRFSRWPPWRFGWRCRRPSWISEWNDFSNSESLRCYDASYQVIAQSDLQFGRRCLLKFSKWLTWQPSWISEWNDYSNSESPCGPNASQQVSAQSDLGFGSRCGFKIFKMAAQATILNSWTKRF